MLTQTGAALQHRFFQSVNKPPNRQNARSHSKRTAQSLPLLRCPSNVLGDKAPSSLADRGHSLRSLILPPAALPSLPYEEKVSKILIFDGCGVKALAAQGLLAYCTKRNLPYHLYADGCVLLVFGAFLASASLCFCTGFFVIAPLGQSESRCGGWMVRCKNRPKRYHPA